MLLAEGSPLFSEHRVSDLGLWSISTLLELRMSALQLRMREDQGGVQNWR